jgi:hypothetical protein
MGQHQLPLGPLPHSNTRMKILYIILGLCFSGYAYSATINAVSPARADVETAYTAASNGDTILIPSGTATWETRLVIEKSITLQGAGIGQTIIRDGVTNPAAEQLMQWTLVASNTSRLTGIEFNDNGRPAGQPYIITFQGSNTNGSQLRVDHCKFDNLKGFALVPEDIIGVIDNNYFTNNTGIPIYVFHRNWNGYALASGSWAAASGFGTSQFLFIENNTFIAGSSMAAFDCYAGARVVFRYNTCSKAFLEVHGTDSSGIWRGGRAFEVYNNTFSDETVGDYIINGRSGVFLVHNNFVTNNAAGALHLAYYRAAYPFSPWGPMDGTNAWDVNDAGNPFATPTAVSGTASGGAYSYPTVTVSGAGWAVNQWKGYVVKKLSPDVATQKASFILENTSDAITYYPTFTGATMLFTNGNTFEINRVTQAMDQPGRSQGTILPSEDPPVIPVGWNDQITDPCYSWNNTNAEGGGLDFSSGYEGLIRENEHYFNETPAPGYATYTYPHPLRGTTPPVATFGTGTFGKGTW